MLRATLHESIADIDRADWDRLGSDPLSSHAMLAALEQAALPRIRTWCATIRDANGRIVAAAPIARIEVDAERLTHGLFRTLIKGVRKVYPGFLRTALMICGTPLSVGNPPVRHPQELDLAPMLERLAGLLEQLGRSEDAPWLAFKEFPGDQLADAHRALYGNGSFWFIAPSEPNSALSIEWSSYDEYLGDLRSHYRYKIRSAARTLARDGVNVDVVPLAEGYDRTLHPLYEAVVDRAAVQLERLTPEFFTGLGQTYGDAAQLIRFSRDGKVIGWRWEGHRLDCHARVGGRSVRPLSRNRLHGVRPHGPLFQPAGRSRTLLDPIWHPPSLSGPEHRGGESTLHASARSPFHCGWRSST
jgi:hypothetical protein